jgi:molybdopterin/thiamine biosynthesis adenylyltransferase
LKKKKQRVQQQETTTTILMTDIQDERDRYDRQIRTIGRDAMQKILQSKTLLCGMNGVGAEIAKNLVLMGAKHLTLYDTVNTSYMDLSSQVCSSLISL